MDAIISGYRCAALTAIALSAAPLAIQADTTAPPPPEVKKTVDMFVGHWTLTGTDLEPNAKEPAPVTATLDCRPAALGAAVNCLIAADVAGTQIEAATVIGYSPDEHVVRWMEISSTGEYHDHRGSWKADAIQFEPLTYTVTGAKMTEHLNVRFPSAGRMVWKATTQTSEGQSRLELAGTRG
jgi:hypothetical protein